MKKLFFKVKRFTQLLIQDFKKQENRGVLKEIHWAHIYNNSIRGEDFLRLLGLNIGRWAGGYPFFYILNRVLKDYRPSSILELGLGESTKLISSYLDNVLIHSSHIVVEHSEEWTRIFESTFKLCDRSKIINMDLCLKDLNGFNVHSYHDFEKHFSNSFDLYVIDGPYGSTGYSRFDIVSIVQKFLVTEKFIIVFDDSNRFGELDTIKVIFRILKEKNIKYFTQTYSGIKSTTIICSEDYKYATSL